MIRLEYALIYGTFELCGPKIQGNPYGLRKHHLFRHGEFGFTYQEVPRDFDGLKKFFETSCPEEGYVYIL